LQRSGEPGSTPPNPDLLVRGSCQSTNPAPLRSRTQQTYLISSSQRRLCLSSCLPIMSKWRFYLHQLKWSIPLRSADQVGSTAKPQLLTEHVERMAPLASWNLVQSLSRILKLVEQRRSLSPCLMTAPEGRVSVWGCESGGN